MIKFRLVKTSQSEINVRRRQFYEVISPWQEAFWATMSILGILHLFGKVVEEGRWQLALTAVAAFLAFYILVRYERRKILSGRK